MMTDVTTQTPIAPITVVLRSMVSDRTLPTLTVEGKISLTPKGSKGRAAKKDAVILSGPSLDAHIQKHFPAYPLHCVPSATIRALRHRQNGIWTDESVKGAAREFMVDAGTKVLIVWPELFFNRELKAEERFKFGDGGVKTPCPYCKSNKHVKFLKWECFNNANSPRRVSDLSVESTFLCSPRMDCSSLQCVGEVPVLIDDQKTGLQYVKLKDGGRSKNPWDRSVERAKSHTFTLWTPACFNTYPSSVKSAYSRYVYGLGSAKWPRRGPYTLN
jgi:hypothetical protein